MAEAESSATASKRPRNTAPGSRGTSILDRESLPEGILFAANGLKLRKERSLDTARDHLRRVKERGREVKVGLIGDSMIERMDSTGEWETLQPWPSETMASDSDIQAMNDAIDDTDVDPIARLQGVANFGCGGDKIRNVLYRVFGDVPDLKGLAQELRPSSIKRRNQKLLVIQAGTNNLHKTHGLRDADVYSMEILLKTLHLLSRPGTKFLVTGLFYRRDIPNKLVDQANEALQSLVARLDREFQEAPKPTEQSHGGTGRGGASHKRGDSGISGGPWDRDNGTVSFLPAPQVDNELLEDHVHLNKEGYRLWMQTLLPKVHEMLPIAPPPGTSEPPSPHFSDKDEVREFYSTDSVRDGQEGSL